MVVEELDTVVVPTGVADRVRMNRWVGRVGPPGRNCDRELKRKRLLFR